MRTGRSLSHFRLLACRNIDMDSMDVNRVFNQNGIIQTTQDLDLVKEVALEVALDIVSYSTNTVIKRNSKDNKGGSWSLWRDNDREVICQTMRRTVQEMTERHAVVFTSMVNKVELTEHNLEAVFTSVVNKIFEDNLFNWGRLVSVYAFGARLAKFAHEKKICDAETIGPIIGNYVSTKLGCWITEKGGWGAFVEYFPEPIETQIEQTLWKGLLCTAGIGLATLAAVVVVR